MVRDEVIERELKDIRKKCEECLPNTKVVTCVPAMIRIELKQTEFRKVYICLTYPKEYPHQHILLELKSKTLSDKLLNGLVHVSENEAKKYLGKPHVLPVVQFIHKFFAENPLSCCSDEIAKIKEKLEPDLDKIKLLQKTSSLSLHIFRHNYFLRLKVLVPFEYPQKQISLEDVDTNFPRVFKVWFVEQAKEIARQCVMPPLKKQQQQNFEVKPSLEPAVSFLIDKVKRYPDEICQFCRKRCFPSDPQRVVHNENAADHVERVYCTHCYHHDCLILYMKSPPFNGVKKCLGCGQKIYHEKWKVTPELAEARWAHKQAKQRELEEVVDFFGDLKS